jgi:pimeloyl-ACP methyl ester carboxylesterase
MRELIRLTDDIARTDGSPRTFTLHVHDDVIEDLRQRLDRVKWPDEVAGSDWRYGTSLDYLQQLVRHWRYAYDWRLEEAALNRFSQFTVPIAGVDLHFIHEPGVGPDPMPLLLPHGWPGSVVEFRRLIPLLTDPERFGGDARDAFNVVAPSLPGYPLSFTPGQPRFGMAEIVDVLTVLMTDVLGYRQFAGQGGDWGAFIVSRMAALHPDRMIGIHLGLLAVPRETERRDPTREELQYIEELRRWQRDEAGYSAIMGSKPQTLAYGLTDSPVGLAAWIVEKFHGWTDCGGDVERSVPRDVLLTNIMLYWVTGAINASAWPYVARLHNPWIPSETQPVVVPTAHAAFPKEIIRPPRRWAERYYTNIQRWTAMGAGGHFAALEQPEALAADIRAFFRTLRR